ncbi:hypothetical protein V1522DRAFT_407711 [Lipomyces starkeyi]
MTSSHPDSGVEINFCPSSLSSPSAPVPSACPMLPFEIPFILQTEVAMDGTIHVLSYSDEGGLYNCADITISLQGAQISSHCVNATGISSAPWEGPLAQSEQAASESGVSAAPTGAASKNFFQFCCRQGHAFCRPLGHHVILLGIACYVKSSLQESRL